MDRPAAYKAIAALFASGVIAILYTWPPSGGAVIGIPGVLGVSSETSQVATVSSTSLPVVEKLPISYAEVVDSCDPSYGGTCVNLRSGAGADFPSVLKLRKGIVLRVANSVVGSDGHTWYKIKLDDFVRYPERVTSSWFVSADVVQTSTNDGDQVLGRDPAPKTQKRIVVDRTQQMLYAYDGDVLFMQQPVSTGLELTPTPRGMFTVYRKTPSRYMQGPLPDVSDQYYDLPGVPWNMYFTSEGGAIHGAYWHNNFGQPWSHGCVNLPPEKAKELYEWADLGTPVEVRD